MRRYFLPLLTLVLIVTGAAMPFLVSRIQDGRTGQLQEELELNAVSLTLRQDDSVAAVLRLVASEPDGIEWRGETALSEQEAREAAMLVLEELSGYGLIPAEDVVRLWELEVQAEPLLLAAEDGTALVWVCRWDGETDLSYSIETDGKTEQNAIFYAFDPLLYGIVLDDATGKAVGMQVNAAQLWDLIGGDPVSGWELWSIFLQDYYEFELDGIRPGEEKLAHLNGDRYQFDVIFTSRESGERWESPLRLYRDIVIFNL